MRPFVFFFTFFSFFSAAALVAARLETISNQDKRISYTGNWRDIVFPGGTFSYIRRSGGIATLRVTNVTNVAATVMVQNLGDTVGIALNGKLQNVEPTTPLQPAWNSGPLDPKEIYTIEIIKQNRDHEFTSLYSFLVTNPDPPTTGTVAPVSGQSADTPVEGGASSTTNSSGSSSPPPTSPALAAQQSNTGPILSGAKLAGVIAGSITGLALIIGIVLYRRRMVSKRKASSTAYWEYITARSQQPPGPQSPSMPTDGRTEVREMP